MRNCKTIVATYFSVIGHKKKNIVFFRVVYTSVCPLWSAQHQTADSRVEVPKPQGRVSQLL